MESASNPGRDAFGELIASAYPTLRRMAAARAASAGLSPSSIVQETLLRVLKQRQQPLSEQEFEAVAWRLMNWIIVDRVRADAARERREEHAGPGAAPTDGAEVDPPAAALIDAMKKLADLDARKAEVVTLCLCCGLSHERAAELVGVSAKTVHRDLEFAKSWLATRLAGVGGAAGGETGEGRNGSRGPRETRGDDALELKDPSDARPSHDNLIA